MNPVIVAPFSNSDIRDWPVRHFADLVGLLIERDIAQGQIRVIGTRSQAPRAREIVRRFPATRVVNDCGRTTWADVVEMLKTAACVIGNNSGVAHLSGALGTPTVCIFGGSHQREEWRPLGPKVVIVTRQIGCSPCQLDHGQTSPFNKACLRLIKPADVADATAHAIKQDNGRATRLSNMSEVAA